jgi:hypothetical protein
VKSDILGAFQSLFNTASCGDLAVCGKTCLDATAGHIQPWKLEISDRSNDVFAKSQET